MKKTKNVDEWYLHSVSSKVSQSLEKSVDLQTTAQRTVNPKDCLSKPHKRMELSPGMLLSRHSFYWGSHYFLREPNSLKHQLRTIRNEWLLFNKNMATTHILLLSEQRESNRLLAAIILWWLLGIDHCEHPSLLVRVGGSSVFWMICSSFISHWLWL